jgi:hypothetical protein
MCAWELTHNEPASIDQLHQNQPLFSLPLPNLLFRHIDDVVATLGSQCVQPNHAIVAQYCAESIDMGSVNAVEIAFTPSGRSVAIEQLEASGAKPVVCGTNEEEGYFLGSSADGPPVSRLVLLVRSGTARLFVAADGYCLERHPYSGSAPG